MPNTSETSAERKNLFVTVEMPADIRRRFASAENLRFVCADNRTELKRILLGAFAVRVIALLIIFLCTPGWSSGFLFKTATNNPDDIRYEAGAMEYAKTASSIIDPEAFKFAFAKYGDWKGYETNWFQATPLWYWVVCIVMYVTRTNLAIRLLNITLACFGIKYLYLLAELLFDKKTASLAAKLYAFLPYPVLFSCFAYKDHLMFLSTAHLLYASYLRRYHQPFSAKRILAVLLSAFCCVSIRSGVSFLLILVCLIIAFSQYLKKPKALISICVILLLGLWLERNFVADSWDAIRYKASVYANVRAAGMDGAISIASVLGIKDFYKLPVAFLIAVITPINMKLQMLSWHDFTASLNLLVMPPVAVGAFLDIVLRKHRDAFPKLICLAYYCVSIIASIGIFRHYFSLLFIPIIMCAHYLSHSSFSQKVLHATLSFGYIAALMLYLSARALRG